MGVLRLNGKAYGGGIDVIEVTQAQYNDLPESKLSDDILYVISDSVNGSDGYPPLIYSLEEREVGVWTDGKPLYQITVDQTIGSDADYTVFASGIENAHLVSARCEYSSGRWMSFDYISLGNIANNRTCYVEAWNGALKFHNQANYSIHWIATIQYTKIADVAGSGIWNGQGGIAHHYSTNETVIGTWIDGKPLYEKTFNVNTSIAQNTTYVVDDITGLDIVNVSGIALTSSTSGFNIPYYNSASEQAQLWWSSNELKFYQKGYAITGLKITIQYTKTTD